jgi:hypothetical protein
VSFTASAEGSEGGEGNVEIESGEEVTLSFSVDGELPDGGLPIAVDSESIRTLSNILEFNENEEPIISDLEGIDPTTFDGDVDDSGFFATLQESEGSISLPLAPTSNEFQEVSFTLLDGENYGVDPQANSASLIFETSVGEFGSDLNGDGSVDLDDLGIFGAAFGSTEESDNFNPQADLTGDGLINLNRHLQKL